MGFGYLLIGYLIAFVLYLTVQVFGIGGLALLVGYGMMMLGLWELTRYNRAFGTAKWICVPLLLVALFQLVGEVAELLLLDVVLLEGNAVVALTWVRFACVILFNFAMLYGVRAIAQEVELLHVATKAVRNAVFVGLYAIVYLLTNFVFAQNETIRAYFVFSLMLTQVVYMLLNLALLISCTKNICAEGQEEVPQEPHRWEFLNKVDRVYDRTRQKNIDDAKAAGEALAERHRRKKEEKQKQKKR